MNIPFETLTPESYVITKRNNLKVNSRGFLAHDPKTYVYDHDIITHKLSPPMSNSEYVLTIYNDHSSDEQLFCLYEIAEFPDELLEFIRIRDIF
jgi:hypothetical protein